MGYSQGWLAVRGEDSARALELLNLRKTGTKSVFAEKGFTLIDIKNDWFVVVEERTSGDPLPERTDLLTELSKETEIVTCEGEPPACFEAVKSERKSKETESFWQKMQSMFRTHD